jgi:hypothetical protein
MLTAKGENQIPGSNSGGVNTYNFDLIDDTYTCFKVRKVALKTASFSLSRY